MAVGLAEVGTAHEGSHRDSWRANASAGHGTDPCFIKRPLEVHRADLSSAPFPMRMGAPVSVARTGQRAVAFAWMRSSPPRRYGRSHGTTDESQGRGRRFLDGFRPSDRSGCGLGGPQIDSDGVGFVCAAVGRPVRAPFWRATSTPTACRCDRRWAWRALGCRRARADDVSKRRRQGRVACRATSPFEGVDARPGVTLAPTFAGAAACQSRTIRV